MKTGNRYRILLTIVMAGYLPLLALICLIATVLAFFLFLHAFETHGFVLDFLAGALLALTVLHFLTALPTFFQRTPDHEDELEFEFPREFLGGLREFVSGVARQRQLPAPYDVRLSPDTVAHVYNGPGGVPILVIGCVAVAALSQKALTGVIAHELGHFAAGDTQVARAGVKWFRLIGQLEVRFATSVALKWNPLVWLVRGYHRLFLVVWCAHSREAEYAADRQEVAVVGSEEAASTLILLEVMDRLPWTRLSSIAGSYATARERIDDLFSEQMRRLKRMDPQEWRGACRKALKEKGSLFDSHPVLRDRLQAMGVSPRKATRLALELFRDGEPAQHLFPNWPLVEKLLTQQMMEIFREYYAARQEFARMVLGGR
jgi:Zn-dependent protease with chaperone function